MASDLRRQMEARALKARRIYRCHRKLHYDALVVFEMQGLVSVTRNERATVEAERRHETYRQDNG